MFAPILLAPGDTLEIGALESGLRGYLALFGGLDIQPVLGSRSTDLKCHIGGMEGRALRAGDALPVLSAFRLPQEQYALMQKHFTPLESWMLSTLTPHGYIGSASPAASAHRSRSAGRHVHRAGIAQIQPFALRRHAGFQPHGAKLSGTAVEAKNGVDILSDGIVEGSVQISANGQPIVQLADHQSTGGYAKIGTVISCDIPAMAQVRPRAERRLPVCDGRGRHRRLQARKRKRNQFKEQFYGE